MPTTEGDLRPAKLTYDELKARKQPNRKTVRLALESAPRVELSEAREAYEEAKVRAEADPSQAARQAKARALSRLDAARKAAETSSYEWSVQAISKVAYEELINQYKPTDKQKNEWEREGRTGAPAYDLDQFPPVLVAACTVDPDLTDEQAKEMWLDAESPWSQGDLLTLFFACQDVCQSSGIIVDLGKD